MAYFWKEDCSRISKIIFPCVIHGNTGADALKVMHRRWCTDGDALKVTHWRWCTEGDAVKVMHGRWCTEGDALKGINWGWCTEGDALKVIYWRIISRTFLAHSALVNKGVKHTFLFLFHWSRYSLKCPFVSSDRSSLRYGVLLYMIPTTNFLNFHSVHWFFLWFWAFLILSMTVNDCQWLSMTVNDCQWLSKV